MPAPARIIAIALAAALAVFGVSRVRKHRKAKRAQQPFAGTPNSSTPTAEPLHDRHLTPTH